MESYNQTAMIRRFSAIALTIVSLVFLFWPSMFRISKAEVRKETKVQVESYENTYEDGLAHKDLYLTQLQATYGDADGKALYNAAMAFYKANARLDWSFWHMRTATTSAWTMAEIGMKNEFVDMTDAEAEDFNMNIVFSVLMNVTFFGMLGAGVLAIILYLLNRSKAGGVLFAVLAVLGAAIFVGYIIYRNGQQNDLLDKLGRSSSSDFLNAHRDPFGPGPSMFLLPIFAIAACVVYQQDPKLSGAFPRRRPAGDLFRDPDDTPDLFDDSQDLFGSTPDSFVNRTAYPKKPASQYRSASGAPSQSPFAEVPRAEKPVPVRRSHNGWICPQCESDNPLDAGICPLCGGKRPAGVVPSVSFCYACGAPLKPGAAFCQTCGARQN